MLDDRNVAFTCLFILQKNNFLLVLTLQNETDFNRLLEAQFLGLKKSIIEFKTEGIRIPLCSVSSKYYNHSVSSREMGMIISNTSKVPWTMALLAVKKIDGFH